MQVIPSVHQDDTHRTSFKCQTAGPVQIKQDRTVDVPYVQSNAFALDDELGVTRLVRPVGVFGSKLDIACAIQSMT